MKVTLGKHEVEMGGKYIRELRSSNDILGNYPALRERMKEDGYLLIRGLHERGKVLAARTDILKKLEQAGKLDPNHPLEEGRIGADNKAAFMGGTHRELQGLMDLVNAPSVMAFFDGFLGAPSLTYDFKWTRAVEKNGFSGAHYDIVYMGRGTKNLYTLWSPLGDVSYEMGGLALCLGSQNFEKIKQTYGAMDVDKDNVTGWFSSDLIEIVDIFGGQWGTAEFKAGDVIIFGMFMMHCSLTNKTDYYRLSADTRYQLQSEPIDQRWIGKDPEGHRPRQEGVSIPMEEARKNWGI